MLSVSRGGAVSKQLKRLERLAGDALQPTAPEPESSTPATHVHDSPRQRTMLDRTQSVDAAEILERVVLQDAETRDMQDMIVRPQPCGFVTLDSTC